jgi:hypothetical protein
MTSSNTPSNSADQIDPWEEIADLVGLEGGKEYVAGSPPAPSVEPAASTAPPAVQNPAEAPSERAPEPVSLGDRPAEVTFAQDPAAADVVFGDADGKASQVPAAEEETTPSAAASPVPAQPTAATSAQDSYWDALANWNWDESEGGAGKSKPEAERSGSGPSPRTGGSRDRDDSRERRGGTDLPQRSSGPAPQSSRSAAPSVPHARAVIPATGDDFGLGVIGEPGEFSSPQGAPVNEVRSGEVTGEFPADVRESARPAARGTRGEDGPRRREPAGGRDSDEGDFSRKRRRRRRKRGRSGDREQASSPAPVTPDVPGADWDDAAGPEEDFEDEPDTPASAFGEGLVADGDRAGSPPRGRHRDSRREGPPRRSGPDRAERSEDRFEEELQEISKGGGAPDLDNGDDESGEPPVSYENVPSWEEAISYLLHPDQVQVEAGTDGGASPPRGSAPADQPRQTRHIGNRKHRR